MTSYYRVCTSLSDKGVLIPEGSNLDIYKKGEAYVSVFKYNDEHLKIFKERGTIAGITNVKTDTIFFDLDSGEDIEKARQDALEVVDRLTKKGISPKSISVCLSGAKGFHVSLIADREYTPDQIKSFATNIAGDLPSFDSVVYNANRIIRLEGSVHPKTGLRKTRVSIDELTKLPITDIMNISKELYEFEKLPKVKIPEGLFISDKALESTKMVTDITQGVDYLSNPFGFEPRMLAISQGFFPSGQRNNSVMRLAAKYRGKGLDRETAFALCNIACEKQAAIHKCEKFSEIDLQKNIIDQIYSTTWKGGTYTEHDMPSQLKQYFDEMGVPSMLDFADKDESIRITDSFDSFAQYAREVEKNTIKLGITELDDQLRIMKGHLISVLAPPGVGKCHGKGTKIMMFDGTTKNVEDIVVGDLLMGDDSTPRTVLSLARGTEMLYNIKQANGDDYVVNESHILSLRGSSRPSKGKQYTRDKVIDIPLKDYLSKGVDFRKRMKGYKVPVEFSKKQLELDPYILGAWLGDGTTSKPEFTIAKKDFEILKEIQDWGKRVDVTIDIKNYASSAKTVDTVCMKGNPNTFMRFLRNNKLNESKYIPHNFLTSDRYDRLELLAGLLDTDGYLCKESQAFEISGKSEKLMNQVTFLARSLGFRATINKENKHYKSFTRGKLYEGWVDMYRVHIMGTNLNEIPTRVERKKAVAKNKIVFQDLTRIEVEQMGVGEYFGFTLDGNHRYLLGDFTVTHNTSMLMTFLNNTSKSGQRSYFACYDMDRNTTVAKLIIRHTGESFDEVFQTFLSNDIEKIEYYKKLLKENYNNVTFNFKTGQSVDDLKRAIKSEELRTGDTIDLVAVDYLELIKTDVSDPTASSSNAINGLREIANSGKVVIVLLQPNKLSSKPNEPLLSYNSAKGSSMVAQAVTAMMTMHRPGLSSETPENDEFMGINIVKNRMGGLFAVDFKWEGKTQTIRSLTNDEKFRLSMLREALRERQEDNNDGY